MTGRMLEPAEIIELLKAAYGPLPRRRRRDPLDELVLGVLSQNTSDVNSGRAFSRLKGAFPDWESVLRAGEREVEEAIRPGGLGRAKAVRIKALLEEIGRRPGSFDLRALGSMPLDQAKAWLESLPGIGPKTAAVVLLFSFDRPAMPVDTHVHRVARRLGLVPEKASTRAAEDALERAVEPRQVYDLHIYLIEHGRRVCAARRPRCPVCALRHGCPSATVYYPSLSAGAR